MAHQTNRRGDGRTVHQPPEYRRYGVRLQSKPVHPGIDFQPDPQGTIQPAEFQHPHLFGMMDSDIQAMPGAARQFGGVEYTFQQQNPLLNADSTQSLCLFDRGHRKGIGVGQRTGDPDQPVTIAIGFNCGRYPLAGGCRPYPLEIVNQCPQIEAHCSCSTHDRNL